MYNTVHIYNIYQYTHIDTYRYILSYMLDALSANAGPGSLASAVSFIFWRTKASVIPAGSQIH